MKALVVTIRNKRDGAVIPSYDIFSRVGNLSYQQLVNLRHRGAFTTVSATFATCCQLAKHLEAQGDEPLLRTWYKVCYITSGALPLPFFGGWARQSR